MKLITIGLILLAAIIWINFTIEMSVVMYIVVLPLVTLLALFLIGAGFEKKMTMIFVLPVGLNTVDYINNS